MNVAVSLLDTDRLSNLVLNYPGSELWQLFLTLTKNIASCFLYNFTTFLIYIKNFNFTNTLKSKLNMSPQNVSLLKILKYSKYLSYQQYNTELRTTHTHKQSNACIFVFFFFKGLICLNQLLQENK